MATVANKASYGPLDKPYTGINRKVTGNPGGTVTPEYAGERVLSDDEQVYKATDLTDTGWMVLNLSV